MVNKNIRKDKYVIMCPKCNSTDVQTDFSNPAMVESGMFINSRVCNNCGYRGDFFPKAVKDRIPKLKNLKHIGKRELVNPKYYSNVIWLFRIIGPIAAIVSLLFILFGNSSLFILGLISILPFSLAAIILSYKNDWTKKHKLIKAIIGFILVYSCAIATFLAYYFIYR
ncbi:hypothetical protein HYV50_00540 [Candidatus Pacearchaeota archaeon]|nr:hypothetical protein [Candidatus Pacearchaeota archaeon]